LFWSPFRQAETENGVETEQGRALHVRRQVPAQRLPGYRQRARQIEIVVDLVAEAFRLRGVGRRRAGVAQRVHAIAHSLERDRRGVERVPREIELAAVMPRQAEIAKRERIVAAVDEILDAQELPRRLRHLR